MMNNVSVRKTDCDYSFEMLYEAAFGKSLSSKQKMKLQLLPQEKINELVIKWAEKAKWATVRKRGNDGIDYISFHP